MKYYHLSLKITPYMCKSYTQQIVISEDPLEWSERNDNHHSVGGGIAAMTQYREIDSKTFEIFSKKNPISPWKGNKYPESCRIFIMNKRDYS